MFGLYGGFSVYFITSYIPRRPVIGGALFSVSLLFEIDI